MNTSPSQTPRQLLPSQILSDADFKVALLQIMPELRAFARSLVGRRDAADDLVQDTLIRAWGARKRFEACTNMRAWTFRILRNRQRTLWQRSKRWVEWDGAVERTMVTDASQGVPIELQELYGALQQLPPNQREALILVGAGGLSHEEAAEICQCALGTIKSRVARARQALERILANGSPEVDRKALRDVSAFDRIMGEIAQRDHRHRVAAK